MKKKLIEQGATGLCRTRPCMIVTTRHENGIVNAGTFGAYTNVGPEEIGVAIGMRSDTYRNIRRDGEFVINILSIDYAQALELCGRNVPGEQSELDTAHLTTQNGHVVKAPMIREAVAAVECRYWKELEIGYHSFVVGKVLCGHLLESLEDDDGSIDVVKARLPFNVRYPDPLYATLAEKRRV